MAIPLLHEKKLTNCDAKEAGRRFWEDGLKEESSEVLVRARQGNCGDTFVVAYQISERSEDMYKLRMQEDRGGLSNMVCVALFICFGCLDADGESVRFWIENLGVECMISQA